MDAIRDCPGAALLEAVAGAGSDDAVLLAHIAACGQCRATIEDIKQNNQFLDEFTHELRPHAPGELFEDPGIPTDLMPGYRLMGEIHRGAQGIVYRAEQERTRRMVAIKMLLQGAFATPRQRARFEREAEIAGQLRHPCIVTVYDSMTVKGGRFALVMEFIDGATLDDWSNSLASLAPNDRIRRIVELFAHICDAVHYAHQRGVIHRDLKPANILVDLEGRPQVLDFGIAKLSGPSGDGPMRTIGVPAITVTQPGEFAGTLAYASPEQLSGKPDLIDTRTDVYSLGVILYELLTREMPYDVRGSFSGVIDNILNEQPANPVLRNRAIDDDLATIVLRALVKERERRYQSAGALLADIRHYLDGDAIDARRDSSFYVLRKAIVKRKALAVSLASLIIALVIGVGVGMYALAQRDKRREVEASHRVAQANAQEAERERTTAEAARAFLDRMLKSVRPASTRGKAVTVLYVLEQAEAELNAGKLDGQPEVEAQVRRTLGEAYIEMADYVPAARHLERSLALLTNEQRDRGLVGAAVKDSLGRALGLSEQFARAMVLLDQSLAVRTELTGADSPETAATLNTIGVLRVTHGDYARAETVLRKALAIRRAGLPDDRLELVETLSSLASAAWQGPRGDYSQAEDLLRECLEIAGRDGEADHPNIAESLYQLAHMMMASGARDQARDTAEKCVAMRIRLFGKDNILVAEAQDMLSGIYAAEGNPLALPTLENALETFERVHGKSHPLVVRGTGNLGKIYYKLGDFEKAALALKFWYAGLKADPNVLPQELEMAERHIVWLYEEELHRPEELEEWRRGHDLRQSPLPDER